MILNAAIRRVLAGNKYLSLLTKGVARWNYRLELISYRPNESWTFEDLDKAAKRPGKWQSVNLHRPIKIPNCPMNFWLWFTFWPNKSMSCLPVVRIVLILQLIYKYPIHSFIVLQCHVLKWSKGIQTCLLLKMLWSALEELQSQISTPFTPNDCV